MHCIKQVYIFVKKMLATIYKIFFFNKKMYLFFISINYVASIINIKFVKSLL